MADGPVLEIADFAVAPGHAEEFLAAYRQARSLVTATPGCRSVRLTRGVERPDRFVLLVEWDAVSDHEAFRAGDGFPRWRALIGPHFAAPPQVEHVVDVEEPG